MCRRCGRVVKNAPEGNIIATCMVRRHGPGTILKVLIRRWLGIKATPNCPCNTRARQMDAWGPDECERRLDEIVKWLGEEAGRRRLPFFAPVARQAVLFAIRKARRTAAG